jgi:hypothetical protein
MRRAQPRPVGNVLAWGKGKLNMPRPCDRVRLENGLKLDLNRLARRGFIQPGGCKGGAISWSYDGKQVAWGVITADMCGANGPHGWFRIQVGSLDQRITLVARPRHFGGHQWYFVCPYTKRHVSVLWMPPGARDFACRQKWGRQVAYVSQFSTLTERAHQGQARIKSRLCSIGGFDPSEWDLPPKPKWMRWRTYNRAMEKFDRYESILDEGTILFAAKLMGRA